jgi:hypothetical protein
MAFADEYTGISPVSGQSLGGQYLAVTATGSTLANSTPLSTSASLIVVAGADGTKGVTLPQAMVGDECWIFNNSGSTLKVWPGNASTAIAVPGTGLGSGGSAFSHLTYKAVQYKMVTSTQWLPNVTA